MEQQQPRQMTKEEVAAMRAECTPNVQFAVRQVAGGFILNGVVTWSKDGDAVAQQQDEATAKTGLQVLDLLDLYLTAHTFSKPVSQKPVSQKIAGIEDRLSDKKKAK